jgi:hypothetical protein
MAPFSNQKNTIKLEAHRPKIRLPHHPQRKFQLVKELRKKTIRQGKKIKNFNESDY